MNINSETAAVIGFLVAFVLTKIWDVIFLSIRTNNEKKTKADTDESKQTLENMIGVARLEKNFETLSAQLSKFDFKIDAFLGKLEKQDNRLTRLEVLYERDASQSP